MGGLFLKVMRKLVYILSLMIVFFTSCQKDWTCECEKRVNDNDTFSFEKKPINNRLKFKASNKCKDMGATSYDKDGNKVEYRNCVIDN
jgi:hypothetical protein